MNIEERIKQVREAKRLSKSEIAEKLGFERQNYQYLEKRGVKLTYEQIEKISDALGVSTKYLLFGEEENTDTNKVQLLEKEIELLKKEIELLKSENKRLGESENFAREILKALQADEFTIEDLKKIPIEKITETLSLGLLFLEIRRSFIEMQEKKKENKTEAKKEIPKFTVKKES